MNIQMGNGIFIFMYSNPIKPKLYQGGITWERK